MDLLPQVCELIEGAQRAASGVVLIQARKVFRESAFSHGLDYYEVSSTI
jgi:hypothetical protein